MRAGAGQKTVMPVCLFAQFHPGNRIRAPVLRYVSALQACGYRTFVACSGDAPPPAGDLEALAATGAVPVCRANRGLDFGAWQELIGRGCADGADAVLLANDSVFGPFHALSPIFERMRAGSAEVWGLVESRQRSWHLQSWFLHFTGEAFRTEPVRRVFALPFGAMSKEEIIRDGELGLGRALRSAGLRWDAFVRFEDGTWLARQQRLNTMHLDWRHHLIARGLPFLKAELPRANFLRLPWAPEWDRVLRQDLGVETAPLHEYLYEYSGRVPATPGAPYPVPVGPLSLRRLIGFTLATHDRTMALRSLLRRPGR